MVSAASSSLLLELPPHNDDKLKDRGGKGGSFGREGLNQEEVDLFSGGFSLDGVALGPQGASSSAADCL